jgi:hypothetical protein
MFCFLFSNQINRNIFAQLKYFLRWSRCTTQSIYDQVVYNFTTILMIRGDNKLIITTISLNLSLTLNFQCVGLLQISTMPLCFVLIYKSDFKVSCNLVDMGTTELWFVGSRRGHWTVITCCYVLVAERNNLYIWNWSIFRRYKSTVLSFMHY